MSYNKLILKESELVEFIQEIVEESQFDNTLNEQRSEWEKLWSDIVDLPEDLMSGKLWDRSIPAQITRYYSREYEENNHVINQTAAIVLYAAGALFCAFGKTPQTKMLCVELEALAILIELIDFQQYMEEEDYYNAGLVAAFIWFPIGRLTVKGLKTLFPKIFQKAINKFIRTKQTPKQCFDYLIRTQGQKFVGTLSQVMKKNPGILGSLKSASNKVINLGKQLQGFLNKKPWWLPDAMASKLRGIQKYIIVPLYKTIQFLLVILGSIAAYDPAIIAPLFGWAGRKWDITTFTNIEDWLESLAEDSIGGVHIWHSILEKAGSVEGVVTTTRIDCDMLFYQWDDVVESFKETYYHKNIIRSHGYKKDGINLTSLWEAWKDGWRPDIKMGELDILADEPSDKQKKKIQDTYKLTLWSDLKKLLPHKDWFLKGGLESEVWGKFEDALKTCKDWLEFIKKEESKDVVSLIIAMSGSSGFPGDK